MAIWYLDPEFGNDANDGTTFALRKKTITAFSAAILTPGDTIRMIGNKVNNIGQATFRPTANADTNKNNDYTVAWAAAKTIGVEACDAVWTAAPNVTAAVSTTRWDGTNSVTLAIATAFTTGKIAYRALGAALDLSSMRAISMLFGCTNFSVALPSGLFELRLCSDAVGDVPLLAIPLEAVPSQTSGSNTSKPNFYEHGVALPSGINSVALYAISDPGVVTLWIDNIIACKERTHVDHISHGCLIAPNSYFTDQNGAHDKAWFCVNGIYHDGLGVQVRPSWASLLSTGIVVFTPGTAADLLEDARVMLPFRHACLTADWVIQEAGTMAAPSLLSGGWNRTDMLTQDAVSCIHAFKKMSQCLAFNGGYWRMEKIGFAQMIAQGNPCITIGSYGDSFDLDIPFFADVGANFLVGGYSTLTTKIKIGRVVQATQTLIDPQIFNFGYQAEVEIDRIINGTMTSVFSPWDAHIRPESRSLKLTGSLSITGSGSHYLIDQAVMAVGKKFHMKGLPAIAGGYLNFQSMPSGEIHLENCNFYYSNQVFPSSGNPILRQTKIKNNGRRWRTDCRDFIFMTADATDDASDYVQRTGSSTYPVLLKPTNNNIFRVSNPLHAPLAKVLLRGGDPATVSVWIGRYINEFVPGIGTLAGESVGVAQVRAYATGALAAPGDGSVVTWEKKTLTFTPTADGLVPIYAIGYNPNALTGRAWFCDLEVTQ